MTDVVSRKRPLEPSGDSGEPPTKLPAVRIVDSGLFVDNAFYSFNAQNSKSGRHSTLFWLYCEIERIRERTLDALEATGVPIGTCITCFRRDMFIHPRERTADLTECIKQAGCETDSGCLTALPCSCQTVMCYQCILRTARNVEGADASAIDVPCPVCKEHCLLETNTLYVESSQAKTAVQSVQSNNGLTTRVFFNDLGFSDTRGRVRFAHENCNARKTSYSPAPHGYNDSDSSNEVVIEIDDDDDGYNTPPECEPLPINTSPLRQRIHRLRRRLWGEE